MQDAAPFFADVALGPDCGRAVWARARDGVRIRVALWPEGGRGTVLLFPGRTEYVEKYGRAAGDLAARGFATLSIDWRGQGLADRQLADKDTGHVMHFADYQMDLAAALDAARAAEMPRPYYLMAHSMGGCIGLRALMEGLDVKAATFTAPMWGINISSLVRPLAWSMAWAARHSWFGHFYAPGTSAKTYVKEAVFEGNNLTTDREMFHYMKHQVAAHPDLALGGPSMHWLYEALVEGRDLARRPAPHVPVLTWLGTHERIVDTAPIHIRMNSWPDGRLEMVEGAEHEVLMEIPAIRTRVFDEAAALFETSR